jgi:hypothetical protein
MLLGNPPWGGGEAHRPFELADQNGAVLAVLAAGADQRFAAETDSSASA